MENVERRRKVGFNHTCSHSVLREDVNGGEEAGLTDEGVLFCVMCFKKQCGKSGDGTSGQGTSMTLAPNAV